MDGCRWLTGKSPGEAPAVHTEPWEPDNKRAGLANHGGRQRVRRVVSGGRPAEASSGRSWGPPGALRTRRCRAAIPGGGGGGGEGLRAILGDLEDEEEEEQFLPVVTETEDEKVLGF